MPDGAPYGLSPAETVALQQFGKRTNVIQLRYARMFWLALHSGSRAEALTFHDIARHQFSLTHHGLRTYQDTVRRRIHDWLGAKAVTDHGQTLYPKDAILAIFVRDGQPTINQVRAKQAEALIRVCNQLPRVVDGPVTLYKARVALRTIIGELSSLEVHGLIQGLIVSEDPAATESETPAFTYPTDRCRALAQVILQTNSEDLANLLIWEMGATPEERRGMAAKPYDLASYASLRSAAKDVGEQDHEKEASVEESETDDYGDMSPALSKRRAWFGRLSLVASFFLALFFTAGVGVAAYQFDLWEAWERGGITGAYQELVDNFQPVSIKEKLDSSYVLLMSKKFDEAQELIFGVLADRGSQNFHKATSFYYLALIENLKGRYGGVAWYLEESETLFHSSIDPRKDQKANQKWLASKLNIIEGERARLNLREGKLEEAGAFLLSAKRYVEISGRYDQGGLPFLEWEYLIRTGEHETALEIVEEMASNTFDDKIAKNTLLAFSHILTGGSDFGNGLNESVLISTIEAHNQDYYMLALCNTVLLQRIRGNANPKIIDQIFEYGLSTPNHEIIARLELATSVPLPF